MPKYARRHYEDVAALLKNNLEFAISMETHDPSESSEQDRVSIIIQDFARLFEADNPSFDSDRFFEACNFPT